MDYSSKSEIDSLILFFAITSLSTLIGGIAAEMKNLGKKYCEIILIVLSLISACMCPIFLFHFEIFISISVAFLASAFGLHVSWTSEMLPTKLRDTGFGLFTSLTRLGGFVSQFVFISIAYLNFHLTIWIYLFSLLSMIVLICFLPKINIVELDSELELGDDSEEKEFISNINVDKAVMKHNDNKENLKEKMC